MGLCKRSSRCLFIQALRRGHRSFVGRSPPCAPQGWLEGIDTHDAARVACSDVTVLCLLQVQRNVRSTRTHRATTQPRAVRQASVLRSCMANQQAKLGPEWVPAEEGVQASHERPVLHQQHAQTAAGPAIDAAAWCGPRPLTEMADNATGGVSVVLPRTDGQSEEDLHRRVGASTVDAVDLFEEEGHLNYDMWRPGGEGIQNAAMLVGEEQELAAAEARLAGAHDRTVSTSVTYRAVVGHPLDKLAPPEEEPASVPGFGRTSRGSVRSGLLSRRSSQASSRRPVSRGTTPVRPAATPRHIPRRPTSAKPRTRAQATALPLSRDPAATRRPNCRTSTTSPRPTSAGPRTRPRSRPIVHAGTATPTTTAITTGGNGSDIGGDMHSSRPPSAPRHRPRTGTQHRPTSARGTTPRARPLSARSRPSSAASTHHRGVSHFDPILGPLRDEFVDTESDGDDASQASSSDVGTFHMLAMWPSMHPSITGAASRHSQRPPSMRAVVVRDPHPTPTLLPGSMAMVVERHQPLTPWDRHHSSRKDDFKHAPVRSTQEHKPRQGSRRRRTGRASHRTLSATSAVAHEAERYLAASTPRSRRHSPRKPTTSRNVVPQVTVPTPSPQPWVPAKPASRRQRPPRPQRAGTTQPLLSVGSGTVGSRGTSDTSRVAKRGTPPHQTRSYRPAQSETTPQTKTTSIGSLPVPQGFVPLLGMSVAVGAGPFRARQASAVNASTTVRQFHSSVFTDNSVTVFPSRQFYASKPVDGLPRKRFRGRLHRATCTSRARQQPKVGAHGRNTSLRSRRAHMHGGKPPSQNRARSHN